MLVITRQAKQVIMIGDDIELQVCEIRGDKVRIGITAPKSVVVQRKEVADAIRRQGFDRRKAKTGIAAR